MVTIIQFTKRKLLFIFALCINVEKVLTFESELAVKKNS